MYLVDFSSPISWLLTFKLMDIFFVVNMMKQLVRRGMNSQFIVKLSRQAVLRLTRNQPSLLVANILFKNISQSKLDLFQPIVQVNIRMKT
ncbi:hypothetical protein ALX04_012255 [Lactiplantibacillus plantarum subsp. plantarum]|nr:hypothetical protein ALX04_012255 [Lactiplantibacillus plantarum subsp. plantarum]